jgi:single-stranded DNA-binding protein
MKFKSLFFAAVAAVFSFAACEEMNNAGQDLGSPALTVSVTELTFEEVGGDQAVVLNSTRDWKVTSSAEWVVVDPASGNASADDQTVVVSATVNPEGNRNATLTFTNGMVTKVVKVSQVGTGVTPGVPGEGDGTEASPYSASQALAITKEMEKDVQGANTVYVTGKVAEIKEAYSDQYGNMSFYVTDDGVAVDKNDMFLIFRCKYFGNEKFSSADQLKVGDEVVVVGNLINYYGNTPELKNSYVIKINGETSGSTVTPPAGDDNEGEGEEGGNEEGGQTPVAANKADFSALTASRYYEKSLTTPNGWLIENCQVHTYGTANSNETFDYVPDGEKAVVMNGKTSAKGSITSPVIAGGCGVLSFDYCYAFSESKGVDFKVEVLQNNEVVKTINVVNSSAAKLTTYTWTEEVNITGNFSLKFTNNSPSNNSSSNKDRYSVWNIAWTSKAE